MDINKIKFTMEVEQNNTIPYVHVQIKRSNSFLPDTTVYQKTNLNIDVTPKTHKIAVVNSCVSRAF